MPEATSPGAGTAPATGSLTLALVSDPSLAPAIADVAAATFPLACPPHSEPADVAAFIREHLSEPVFAGYIASDESDVIVARDDVGTIIGYTLVHHRPPADTDVAAVITDRPASEVSKMYVLPDHHARGRTDPPSHLLMRAAVERAADRGSAVIWLGVNQENARAQRFYEKMGFRRVGVKSFDLNGNIEHDFVLAMSLR